MQHQAAAQLTTCACSRLQGRAVTSGAAAAPVASVACFGRVSASAAVGTGGCRRAWRAHPGTPSPQARTRDGRLASQVLTPVKLGGYLMGDWDPPCSIIASSLSCKMLTAGQQLRSSHPRVRDSRAAQVTWSSSGACRLRSVLWARLCWLSAQLVAPQEAAVEPAPTQARPGPQARARDGRLAPARC